MFEPRKLRPFSIEYWSAPIAVMTEMTEKTPMVIPNIVRPERSLFTPNELSAIVMISPNCILVLLFITKCGDRIEARRRPGRRETGDQASQDRHDHARDHEPDGKLNWKRRKSFANSEAHQISDRQSDKSA